MQLPKHFINNIFVEFQFFYYRLPSERSLKFGESAVPLIGLLNTIIMFYFFDLFLNTWFL